MLSGYPDEVLILGQTGAVNGWRADRYVADFYVDKHEVSVSRFCEFANRELAAGRAYLDEWTLEGTSRISGRQEPWLVLSDANGCVTHSGSSPGLLEFTEARASLPITGVTFYGADAFAASCGKSLPSERQWELAAGRVLEYCSGMLVRSNPAPNRAYPWGEASPCETRPSAWLDVIGIAGVATETYDVSITGCLFMGGNVREWVSDECRSSEEAGSAVGSSSAPQFPPKRKVKGGAYFDDEGQQIDGFRCWYPERSSRFIGFRCVRGAN